MYGISRFTAQDKKGWNRLLAELHSLVEVLWKNCFHTHSSFWVNSVPLGYEPESQFFCWLLARGHPQVLETTCFPLHKAIRGAPPPAFSPAKSISNPLFFEEEQSLFRDHLIRLYMLRIMSLFYGRFIWVLNYILKIHS